MYYESFPSREVKYDKEYNSNSRVYEYDHVCNLCYECIVNANYSNVDISSDGNLLKAKLIAEGKIRNNTYKSCAVKTNNGIEVDPSERVLSDKYFYEDFVDKLNECYEIQITIDTSDFSTKERKYMYIGTDWLTFETGSDDNVYQTLVFKNSLQWSVGGLLMNENVEIVSNGATIEGSPNKIFTNSEPGNIKIKSITYKYK